MAQALDAQTQLLISAEPQIRLPLINFGVQLAIRCEELKYLLVEIFFLVQLWNGGEIKILYEGTFLRHLPVLAALFPTFTFYVFGAGDSTVRDATGRIKWESGALERHPAMAEGNTACMLMRENGNNVTRALEIGRPTLAEGEIRAQEQDNNITRSLPARDAASYKYSIESLENLRKGTLFLPLWEDRTRVFFYNVSSSAQVYNLADVYQQVLPHRRLQRYTMNDVRDAMWSQLEESSGVRESQVSSPVSLDIFGTVTIIRMYQERMLLPRTDSYTALLLRFVLQVCDMPIRIMRVQLSLSNVQRSARLERAEAEVRVFTQGAFARFTQMPEEKERYVKIMQRLSRVLNCYLGKSIE